MIEAFAIARTIGFILSIIFLVLAVIEWWRYGICVRSAFFLGIAAALR